MANFMSRRFENFCLSLLNDFVRCLSMLKLHSQNTYLCIPESDQANNMRGKADRASADSQ